MSTLRTIFIALLFIPCSSYLSAQSNMITKHLALGNPCVEKLNYAEANYATGLSSDNDGLVESSIFHALQLRLAYPARTFSRLELAIDELVKSGRTHCIRYKATLASTVFGAPLLIDRNRITATADPNEFFTGIARQLESKLLVSNK